MKEILSPASNGLPFIPDDLTLVQFTLDSHHSTRPTRKEGPWLVDDNTGRQFGYEEVRSRTFGLANALSLRYQVKENDVVLIFSPNHVDYPVAIWATHRLGAIVSGANPTYTVEELVYQLEATNACMILTHSDSLHIALSAARHTGLPDNKVVLFDPVNHGARPNVQDLISEGLLSEASFAERTLAPGEAKNKLAFLSFSSGTTGKPKAVAIPHIAPIANIIQMAVHNRINEDYCQWKDRRFRPGDVALAVLPLYHIYGLVINLHFMLFCGMTVVVVPKYNFASFLRSIERHRITHLFLVPPHVVLLCKSPIVKDYNLSHIRYAMVGAAPLSAELHNQLVALLPNAHVGQSYGMTETCTIVSTWSIETKRGLIGSAGQILAGVTVRIVKPDGSPAEDGEPGELIVKGPSNAIGYYNDSEATKSTFRDGWIHTGDEVVIDKDAHLFVVDRLKEIMKVRGYQVAPADIEGCLFDHPDIADACVVGVPDDYSGEVPLAFVVLNAGASTGIEGNIQERNRIKASIVKHVEDRRVKYKHLTGGVEFIDAIPRNPSGKLLRRFLREQAKTLRKNPRAKL